MEETLVKYYVSDFGNKNPRNTQANSTSKAES